MFYFRSHRCFGFSSKTVHHRPSAIIFAKQFVLDVDSWLLLSVFQTACHIWLQTCSCAFLGVQTTQYEHAVKKLWSFLMFLNVLFFSFKRLLKNDKIQGGQKKGPKSTLSDGARLALFAHPVCIVHCTLENITATVSTIIDVIHLDWILQVWILFLNLKNIYFSKRQGSDFYKNCRVFIFWELWVYLATLSGKIVGSSMFDCDKFLIAQSSLFSQFPQFVSRLQIELKI